jgi:hypothetical protein
MRRFFAFLEVGEIPVFRRAWSSACGRHDFGTRVPKKTGNLKLVMQIMGQ